MKNIKIAKNLLRLGFAFVLLYATVEIYMNPENFLKYVPDFVTQIIPVNLFLFLFAIFELVLMGWLLSGWQTKYSALLFFLLMVGIIVTNLQYFNVLFRNVAIAFSALALAALDQEGSSPNSD